MKMKKSIAGTVAAIPCCLLLMQGMAFGEEKAAPPAEEVTKLDEVVVTAVPLEKYLLTTSVITAKDIEAKGAKNLAEALADVPGLNMHRGKKNNTSLDIRGMTSADTKIFIDGVLVNPLAKMTNSSAVDITMIPADNIAKIEVIKGPAPVLYGTDAKGGVILITTKTGKNASGGKISVTGGSWETLNGNISYGGGDNKFTYYVNAGGEHTNGYMNDDRQSKYINAKLSWKLGGDASLTFTGGYSITDKKCLNGVDPIDGHTVTAKNGFWPGLNSWEFRDWEKTNLALDYGKKVNSKWDYSLKLYRFSEKQGLWANGANYDPASGVTLDANGIRRGAVGSDMGYSTRRWNYSSWESVLKGAELNSNWKLGKNNTLTFGMMYNTVDWRNSTSLDPVNDPFNPDRYRWLEYNNKRYSYYIQDNFMPNDKTTITLGVRHDRNEVSGPDNGAISKSATNPTLNVLYQIDGNNTLRGSVGRTCSFPSVEQLFGVYGNAGLNPEKANNYEIGWKHTFDKTLQGDLALFYNDITDKIDRDPVSRRFYNRTSATIKGVELELNKKFSEKLKGFINYTYLNTSGKKADGSETELTYTPRNHVSYGVDYQFGKGYTASLTGHWVSRRFTDDTGTGDTRTKVNGQTPVYSYIGSYHVVNFSISRQVRDNLEWYVALNNIFDKQYEDELFYPAAGRSVVVGVNYRF